MTTGLSQMPSLVVSHAGLPAEWHRVTGEVKQALCGLPSQFAEALHGIHVLALHPGWVKTEMGGEGATLDANDCAVTLLETLDKLPPETTGQFIRYDGEPLAW